MVWWSYYDICRLTSSPTMLTLSQGDFRQCLPIVPRAPQSQIAAATLPFSTFWKDIQILRLSTNMRLLAHAGQMNATEQANAEHFAKWLLNVGDGTAAEPDNPFKVTIPPRMNPSLTSNVLTLFCRTAITISERHIASRFSHC